MKDNQNLSLKAWEEQAAEILEKAKITYHTVEDDFLGLLTEESLNEIKERLTRERAEVVSSENKPYQITPGLFTGKGGKILIIDSQIKEIGHELGGRTHE